MSVYLYRNPNQECCEKRHLDQDLNFQCYSVHCDRSYGTTQDFVSEGIHSLIKTRMSSLSAARDDSVVATTEMFQIVRETQRTFTHQQALGEKSSTSSNPHNSLVQYMWESLGNQNRAGRTDQSTKRKPLWTIVNAKKGMRWDWCLPHDAVQPQRIPFLYRRLKEEDFILARVGKEEEEEEGATREPENLYVVVVSHAPVVKISNRV